MITPGPNIENTIIRKTASILTIYSIGLSLSPLSLLTLFPSPSPSILVRSKKKNPGNNPNPMLKLAPPLLPPNKFPNPEFC